MEKNIIEVHNLTFTYHDGERPALDHLNFNIKAGSWTAIIGHNGSGKSTLARLLNGLLVPDEDKKDPTRITIDGIELNETNLWNIRDNIGIVFQNPDNQFVGSSVADDVAFGLENRAIPRSEMLKIVPDAIDKVGMSDYYDTEPSQLSGGQKQRVAIAGILAVKPKIIILDESTSMLDPEGKRDILNLVKQVKDDNDLTVISITHDLDEATLADDILVLDDGKLIKHDKPKNIFANSELLKNSGLDLPFVFQVQNALRQQGIPLSPNLDTEEKLVKSLCQLHLKK